MARKGVVINDPSVRSMNVMQWLFEYHALMKREKQYMDVAGEYIKMLRRMAIDMLGLDIGKLVKKDFEYIVPLTMLTGSPEMVSEMFKQAKEEASGEDAAADSDFDALSDYLMERTKPGAEFDDGDMVPFAEPIDTSAPEYINPYLHSDEYKTTLQNMVTQRGTAQVIADDDNA